MWRKLKTFFPGIFNDTSQTEISFTIKKKNVKWYFNCYFMHLKVNYTILKYRIEKKIN